MQVVGLNRRWFLCGLCFQLCMEALGEALHEPARDLVDKARPPELSDGARDRDLRFNGDDCGASSDGCLSWHVDCGISAAQRDGGTGTVPYLDDLCENRHRGLRR